MRTHSLRVSLLFTRVSLLLIATIPVATGCASDPTLRLTSARDHRTYSQSFDAAYAARESDGDVDVVLVDDGRGDAAPAPVRQVMHIRMLWNPTRDLKADHNSASNATIHWYVLGNQPETRADVLEYCGTAFVSLDDSGGTTELTISSATLEPVACRGGLCDPVGRSSVRGTFTAHNDRRRVEQVLGGVRTAVVAANAAARDASFRAKPESPSSSAR